jgi:hypothetical protein
LLFGVYISAHSPQLIIGLSRDAFNIHLLILPNIDLKNTNPYSDYLSKVSFPTRLGKMPPPASQTSSVQVDMLPAAKQMAVQLTNKVAKIDVAAIQQWKTASNGVAWVCDSAETHQSLLIPAARPPAS